MPSTDKYDQFMEWYEGKKQLFHEFSHYVSEKVTNLLQDYNIEIAIKSAREKDVAALNEKCRKK